ncbi:hypothetical protein [Vibrio aestuarianus]|uniref:hypothetical protein n=1 Tax=Vibrio aestuarianus TaxID=28171 RepID=UPI00237CB3E5|nr:hypothetical protein [Vibrio aestuarianus]MDE1338738.1 hypothetical protein [Vibrio aestuarianus]
MLLGCVLIQRTIKNISFLLEAAAVLATFAHPITSFIFAQVMNSLATYLQLQVV